jgi:hypothetical protein
VTTNRKLNGTINCLVKKIRPTNGKAVFGVFGNMSPWTISSNSAGKTRPHKDGGRLVRISDKSLAPGIPVTGKATIDGAHYDWIGILSPEEFDIQFTGSR